MAETQPSRQMQVGDRVLIDKGISKQVFIVARVDIPHSSQRAFVSKSGASYTVGVKIWKSDFTWNEKSRMWITKERT